MPQNFLSCDRAQPMLLPPDLRDWLSDDHLAWFVIDAVTELDLEPFYSCYRADGHGAAAHDPQMMVTLFAYAYAVGERSSRGIERRCREDVAFRVICANQAPDHATIPRFRVRHEADLADLFGQVLGLCGRAGIVDVGVVAVDGTKLAAAASDGATRSYEQIAAEILAEAGRIDAAEDEIHGEARGDELPEGLRTPNGRRAWLREAKEELERERSERPEPVPRDRAERLETCRRRLAEDWRAERRANQRYETYRARGVMRDGRPFGSPPKPYSPPEAPEGKLNTTDPDARRMKFGRNFMPAYNAQAVTTEDQVIVAAEITTRGGDFEELDPMISAAERELATAGVDANPGVVLADAGYWSNEHIDSLRERGMIPIVPADTTRHRPRKTRLGGPYDFMRRVMATDAGGELYSKTPVHGRARLCPDQDEPSDRPLQTKRRGRRSLGMAPDRRHSQPAEAPPALLGGRNGLTGDPKALPVSDSPQFSPPAARARRVYATASRESGSPRRRRSPPIVRRPSPSGSIRRTTTDRRYGLMDDPKRVVERHVEAFNARDADAEPWSEDADFVAPNGSMHGREEVLGFLGVFWDAFPDGRLETSRLLAEGSVVAAEGRFIGTHTGVMRTPAGDVAATGRNVDFRWMSSYQVRGDELASEHLYFDQSELLGQLGLIPAT